tara:strand:+ start:247 stop:618 length:372 start_codon:yes stop_codon:yes gene_type:complete
MTEVDANIYIILINKVNSILKKKYRLTIQCKERLSILLKIYSAEDIIGVAEHVARKFPEGHKWEKWSRRSEVFFGEEKFREFYDQSEHGNSKKEATEKYRIKEAVRERNKRLIIGRERPLRSY